MVTETIWSAVLRCHSCAETFPCPQTTEADVIRLPQVSICPHCGAKSGWEPSVHRLVDLKRS